MSFGKLLKLSFFSLITISALALVYTCWSLPTHQEIKQLAVGSNQHLMDRDQNLIQEIRTDLNKRRKLWLGLNTFSSKLKDAVVKVEDKNFYSHVGVDFFALLRALYSTLNKKRIQGASTISMQTSDLIDPSVLVDNQRIIKGQVTGKIKQIFRGLALDLLWSKEEILETYLNLVHLRGEVQGVHSFSKLYLKKSPLFLDQYDSMVVATLIQAPNRKSKSLQQKACLLGRLKYPDFNCERLVGVIEKLGQGPAPIKAPQQKSPHLARRLSKALKDGNYIHTFIDSDLQEKVMSIMEKHLSYLQSKNVHDSAAIVIDNKSGEVLAYVGAIEKFSQAHHVDGVDSPRQAGSTLKPFLYGRALEKQYVTASSLISDEETAIRWDGGLYRPSNYDNKFHGLVTVRQSLASSLNVPAVKVIRMIGLDQSYQVIKDLNFKNMGVQDNYGASLALGAMEVRLIELANAYRAIANGGQMTPVKLARDPEVNFGVEKTTMSEPTSFILKSILSDPNARQIGFGWGSALETGVWTAVKTGTSKDLRDNWCVGFSSDYTVAVWAGNFDGEAMRNGASGSTGAGPSWNEIMHYLHRNKPSRRPIPPQDIVAKKVFIEPHAVWKKEFYIQGSEPTSDKVKAGWGSLVKIEFPAHGSTLTLDPRKNQNQANIMLRFSGDLPENSQLIFNQKKIFPKNGEFLVRGVKRGQHIFKLVDSQGKFITSSHFKIL